MSTLPRKAPHEFLRLDQWQKRQPPIGSRRKCRCKESEDAWRCWHRVTMAELMGEGRAEPNVPLLIDQEVTPPAEDADDQ